MPRPSTTDAAPFRAARSGTTTGGALLAAKLAPPGPGHPTVLRPRLLTALTRAVHRVPLTLVSGPAGSGKTALAASWRGTEGARRPVGWVTLDDYDDDPATFWSYVVEGLSGTGVPLGELPDVVPGEPPPSGFVPALAAAVAAAPRPVVLVLDNADHLTDRSIVAGLDLLLQHAAERLRLVTCARADPQLPLHRYRLAGSMAEIRGQQLAFTPEETRELFTAMGAPVALDDAARLCARTQGWAVGLRLAAARFARGCPVDELAASLASDDGSVAQYLFAEVLAGQPAHVRRFLLRISVTGELWPDLVERLSGRPQGRRVLAALARANAFVEESPGAPGGYRIHPLFREMLLAELGYEHPAEVVALHRTCAAWYAAHGELAEAVGHAVAAADWTTAARLLVDDLVVVRLLAHGSDPALRGGARPPRDAGGPDAAVLRAALAVAAGHEPAPPDLAAATAAADDDASRPALGVSAALVCLQAGLAAGVLDPTGALARVATAEGAAAGLPDGSRERRDLVALLAGAQGLAAVCGDGPLDEVVRSVRAAAGAASAAGARSLHGRAVGLLGVLEAVQGSLTRAAQHAAEAEASAADAGLDDGDRPAAPAVAAAWVDQQRCAPVEARQELGRAVTRQRSAGRGPEGAALDALLAVLQSRALRLRRDRDAAEGCLRPLLAREGGPRWARQEVAREAARVALARGMPAEALRLLDEHLGDAPDRDLVRARVDLARGDGRERTPLRSAGAAPGSAVEAHVLRSCQLVEAGAAVAAADELTRGLGLARPELLRLPFVDAPPQVRRLLRTSPRLAAAAGWLHPAAPAVAPPAGRTEQPAEEAPPITQDLSERETEVLQHLAEMLSTAEIAATMFISVNTVRTHIRSILRKLGVSRRNQAVRRAREQGLL